jgi:hypothetical protein
MCNYSVIIWLKIAIKLPSPVDLTSYIMTQDNRKERHNTNKENNSYNNICYSLEPNLYLYVDYALKVSKKK